MSRKRSEEAIEAYRGRFVDGAARNGVDAETANLVYDKLAGFSGFGFPKSHAAAFGLLAYQSTGCGITTPRVPCGPLERPADGLLSAGLAGAGRAAAWGGGPARVDVNRSAAKCALEDDAVRIGLEYVQSLGEPGAAAMVEERERRGPFDGVRELAQTGSSSTETGSRRSSPQAPATSSASGGGCSGRSASAFRPGDRSRLGRGDAPAHVVARSPQAATPELPEQTPWERMLADYRLTSLSVGTHPLALSAPRCWQRRWSSSRDLVTQPHGGANRKWPASRLPASGLRPPTAVVFMLLEDEFGQVNLILPPPVYQRFRPLVRAEPLVLARGRFERIGRNQNVLVPRVRVARPARKKVADGADVFGSLDRPAHHFGHR